MYWLLVSVRWIEVILAKSILLNPPGEFSYARADLGSPQLSSYKMKEVNPIFIGFFNAWKIKLDCVSH